MNIHIQPPYSPSRIRRDLRRAIAALQRGAPQEAERDLAQLVARAPDFADAWHYRALAAHQLDRELEAKSYFQRARTLDPERTDFALNEARFHLERGEPAAALEATELAVRDVKLSENATLLAASALTALDQGREAILRLRAFLVEHPAAYRVRMHLISILNEHGERAETLKILADALEYNPADSWLGPLYVAALHGEGRHEEADALCRRLVNSPNSQAAAWLEWAFSALQHGETSEAITRANEALKRDPNLGSAWLLLAEIADVTSITLPAARRQDPIFCFARAKLFDRRGETEAAWHAYKEANLLAEQEDGSYNRDEQEHYVEGLIRHLDDHFIADRRNLGASGSPVIFICGVSRSGTTLLEQMLAAHPSGHISPGGEMKVIHNLIRRHIGPEGLKETGRHLSALPKAELQKMLYDWTQVIAKKAAGSPYVTDKMPSNIFLLGLLEIAFPEAPIILLERDPVAIACSCFVTPFAEGHKFSHHLADIQHYFVQCHRIAAHWESVLEPKRIRRLRYEDMVSAPQESLSELLDSIGLTWDDTMLEFYRRRDPIATASILQVRRPIDPRATSDWMRFAAHLEPWRERLEQAYYNGIYIGDDYE